MDRQTELSLIRRCADLAVNNTREMLDEGSSPVARYADQEQFDQEMTYMRKVPLIAAHSSELSEPGSYVAIEWLEDFPLLLTRDMDGKVHAFANVCRHRGAQLEKPGAGCKRRFTCPYHAWSYDLEGQLKTVPHKSGFPSLDLDNIKLKALPVAEAGGFIWVQRDGEGELDITSYLSGLASDFDWFGSEDHVLFDQYDKVWNANWKIIIEGGVESYHFKIAHRETIAPLFRDTLSVFDEIGPHFRSVLAKESIKLTPEMAEEELDIREHANVLYSLFPMNSILVQPDHFAVILSIPIAPDKTRVSVRTYAPKGAVETDKQKAHWQANFDFTRDTLLEDFVLAEDIQKGIRTGTNEKYSFGRFENALTRFHELNENWIAKFR